MPAIKSSVQSPAALTVTSLTTLASGTYCVSNTIDHTANIPIDVLVRANVFTTNTPSGNKQLIIFSKGSLDNTNFSSGPETGTTTTDEPDLHFVGVIPVNSPSNVHSKVFSLALSYGGVLPRQTKLVFKNDLGVALTAANVQISEVWGVTV